MAVRQGSSSEQLDFSKPRVVPPPENRAPRDLEAERALLGCLLLNAAATFKSATDVLVAEDFYHPLHARVWRLALEMWTKGIDIDTVTLVDAARNDRSGSVLSPADMAGWTADVPSAANAVHYAGIVREMAKRRALLAAGETIMRAACGAPSSKEALEEAQRLVLELSGDRDRRSVVSASDAAERALGQIMEHHNTGRTITGLRTGFAQLDTLLSGLQAADLIILAGRPSMGKAQPLDARVLAADGWKAMGDLRVGEELASVDGAPSFVSGVFPQGTREIFRVTFSDGRSTETCAEHLWSVHYRAWPGPRLLTTDQVQQKLKRKRYRGRLWIDTPSGHFGAAAALPLDPWLLGALLGNGYFGGGTPKFSSASQETLDRLAQAVGPAFELRREGRYDYRIVQAAGSHRAGVSGAVPNGLVTGLKALGLWETHSFDKFIPRCYMGASRDARLQLLRGLMDTDGWAEKAGGLCYSTASRRLADDIMELVRSLGGMCSYREKRAFYTYKGKRLEGRLAYKLGIMHRDPATLVLLSKKRDRVSVPRKRQPRLTFESVVSTRRAAAQCIAVTHPEHLYITDDFIVTHNTALGTAIACNATCRTLFFSAEMTAEGLASRLLSAGSGVDSHRMRSGGVHADEWVMLRKAVVDLATSGLMIDDANDITIDEIRVRARLAHTEKPLGLVVFDYLQLARGFGDNREQEVASVSKGLKSLAKELRVPVIALSQLNRSLEGRPDKRPVMSDLRDSGAIEQDADVVMFVYRDEYYHPNTKEPGVAEIIVQKQRNGPTGTVKLNFDRARTAFTDPTPRQGSIFGQS